MRTRKLKLSRFKESVFRALSEFATISNELKVAIGKELHYCILPRNHVILQPPQACDTLYYIVSGFVISYVLLDGKKVTKAS